MKRRIFCIILAAIALTGCGSVPSYEHLTPPPPERSSIQPVGSWTTGNDYTGQPATEEPTTREYTSQNGLCTIAVKPHYYDVTLDLTGGDHFAAGAAYSEALLVVAAATDLKIEEMLEDYIYESFATIYNDELLLEALDMEKDKKSEVIGARVRTLKAALPEKYRQELDGFASNFRGGDSGFVQDGKLSQEEIDLISLIPDVLREMACSAISLGGTRTASGKRLAARLMEWDFGKDNKMTEGHCVMHFLDGERSLTSVCSLGQLDVGTGVNTYGVFANVLDVGSDREYFSINESSLSYTFALREALETCRTARELGEYMNRLAPRFTFNHNIFVTDETEALVAEDCHTGADGRPVLRDQDTPLLDGLEWHTEDSICVVNAFAAKGQHDMITAVRSNIIRWVKYDRLFSGENQVTLDRFKALMTSESTDSAYHDIRGGGLVFLVIADYDTHTLQAAFTGKEGIVDKPEFLKIAEIGQAQ